MKELTKIFSYGRIKIRTIIEQNEPLFVAQDVCKAVDIEFSQTRRLFDDEKVLRLTQTPGGNQKMLYVNEFGLYNLILGSRKPEAKNFKRWVTHEILPSIRKTGSYSYEVTTRKRSSSKQYLDIPNNVEIQSQIKRIKNLTLSLNESLTVFNRYLEPNDLQGTTNFLQTMAWEIGCETYKLQKLKSNLIERDI